MCCGRDPSVLPLFSAFVSYPLFLCDVTDFGHKQCPSVEYTVAQISLAFRKNSAN